MNKDYSDDLMALSDDIQELTAYVKQIAESLQTLAKCVSNGQFITAEAV